MVCEVCEVCEVKSWEQTDKRFLGYLLSGSYQLSDLQADPLDPENFDEEVKSLVTAWRRQTCDSQKMERES